MKLTEHFELPHEYETPLNENVHVYVPMQTHGDCAHTLHHLMSVSL